MVLGIWGRPLETWPSGQGWIIALKHQNDLQSEQVIHSTDDDIDSGGAACLGPQIVLEIWK